MMRLDRDFQVDIKEVQVGQDVVYVITGGKAHIGATATAYDDQGRIHCKMIELPGHKEGALASEFAQLGAFVLGTTVTVTVGLHLPQASKEEIKQMVEMARKALMSQWFTKEG